MSRQFTSHAEEIAHTRRIVEMERAGEANAARLPAERQDLYADWAIGGGELQPLDAGGLAEVIAKMERALDRLLIGALVVAVVTLGAILWIGGV